MLATAVDSLWGEEVFSMLMTPYKHTTADVMKSHLKRFFLKQRGETVLSRYLLNNLHGHQILVDLAVHRPEHLVATTLDEKY